MLFGKWVGALSLSGAVMLALSGCGQEEAATQAQSIQIEHLRGTTAVPQPVNKVIVFDTVSLDTLTELGVDIAGLPKTDNHLPEFLSRYQDERYLNAGTLFEPDFERIHAAQPDLILGGGRAVEAYDELNRIAPTLDLSVDERNFSESFKHRTLQLGEIFGKREQAQQALDQLFDKAARVREKSSQAGTALVVMTSGGKIATYGPGSRFGFIHDVLGFKPALDLPSDGRHGSTLSFEHLLQTDPDWLFVIDRDSAIGRAKQGETAKAILDNELVRKSKAWNNDRVIYLDSHAIYIAGGLHTLNAMVDQVEQALSR